VIRSGIDNGKSLLFFQCVTVLLLFRMVTVIITLLRPIVSYGVTYDMLVLDRVYRVYGPQDHELQLTRKLGLLL
jgi:hypothetical protein